MYLVPKTVHPDVVKDTLETLLTQSRFTARLTVEFSPNQCKGRHVLKISNVRLRQKKSYCGQHPNACVVRLFPRKHKNASYLEGADWVAFDDMLNDMCDKMEWEADIWSKSLEFKGKMIVRTGRRRRIRYRSECRITHGGWPHYQWDTTFHDEDFADRVGLFTVRSQYPEDTPGIAEWLLCEATEVTQENHSHVH